MAAGASCCCGACRELAGRPRCLHPESSALTGRSRRAEQVFHVDAMNNATSQQAIRLRSGPTKSQQVDQAVSVT